MTLQTAQKLIRLNQDFYDRIGKYWNNDSTYAWQGWEIISEKLKVKNEKLGVVEDSLPNVGANSIRPMSQDSGVLTILDLGCGNGRFYTFLRQQFPDIQIQYIGVDNSEYLLDLARGVTAAPVGILNSYNSSNFKILKQVQDDSHYDQCQNFNQVVYSSGLNTHLPGPLEAKPSGVELRGEGGVPNFHQVDLLCENWPPEVTSQKYDLIVAFGLLHHIPGQELRQQFFQKATELLYPNGQFIFTTWRFNHIDRLRKRIVKFSSEEFQQFSQTYELDETDLDSGDYILNWVKKELAYRYSHDYSKDEIESLISKADFKIVDSFRADGRTEDQNEYFVAEPVH